MNECVIAKIGCLECASQPVEFGFSFLLFGYIGEYDSAGIGCFTYCCIKANSATGERAWN